jgi:2-aminoadipate transaminase
LIGKVFLNTGDKILLESPTYLGALQAWNAYQAQYITVETDDDGMRTDQVEAALRGGPKFIYVLPNFQNPCGITLSLERRKALIELAFRYGIPLIEDDPYGQLRYEGEHLPSLVALDSQVHQGQPYSGNVIYISTFSKILAPGLRLGWAIAPVEVIDRLVIAKQGMDLHTGTFVQMVAHELGSVGFLDQHVHTIRDVYRERRNTMFRAMEKYFPSGVHWTKPQGGLFLWVTLPPELNAAEVLKMAIQEKVAFVPGVDFFPNVPQFNTMRLNFSNATLEMIDEGIRRLGVVLNRKLEAQITQESLGSVIK